VRRESDRSVVIHQDFDDGAVLAFIHDRNQKVEPLKAWVSS
jgi:hypothetical protein